MIEEIKKQTYISSVISENINLNIRMRKIFGSGFIGSYRDKRKGIYSDIYHVLNATVVFEDKTSKYHFQITGRQDAISEAISKIENSLEIKLKELK